MNTKTRRAMTSKRPRWAQLARQRLSVGCTILFLAAGLNHLEAQTVEHRFDGRQQGQFSFTPMTLTAGTKTVEITAAGPVARFGASKTVIRGDVDLDADLRPMPRPPGTWTMTAANGDRIEGTFVWRGTPTGQFGVFTLTGTYQITRGTGRFENATGTGTGTGHLNAVTGATTFAWDGTLVLLKPRRH